MRKRYGQSRIDNCPICGKTAVVKNSQGVPVCAGHKKKELKELKCVCGEWLDVQQGKWGPYFRCINCGNINFKKGLEMNPQVEEREERGSAKKETTIRSDEIDLY